MLKEIYPKNQKGFTLLELLAVLVIMGVIISVGIEKFDLLSNTASKNALNAGIRELNARENLAWTKIKLSDSDWTNDDDVYNSIDKYIGPGFSWDPAPTISEPVGTLHYKSQSIELSRTASTKHSIGSWK